MNNPIMYADPSGHFLIPIPINIIATIFSNTLNVIHNLFEDISNFDFNNTCEQVVINSNYFSYYKGSLVIRHSIPKLTSWEIFGIVFLNRDVSNPNNIYDINTVKHEWGHSVQEKILGTPLYLLRIGIPSIIGCYFDADNYYSQPWENSADILGGITSRPNEPYTISIVDSYLYLFTGMTRKNIRSIIERMTIFI